MVLPNMLRRYQEIVELIEGLNEGGLDLLLDHAHALGKTEILIDKKSRYWNDYYGDALTVWDDNDDVLTPVGKERNSCGICFRRRFS